MVKPCKENCPLCDNESDIELRDNKDKKHVWCHRCGEFEISNTAIRKLAANTRRKQQLSRLALEADKDDKMIKIIHQIPDGIRVLLVEK